MAGLTRVLLPIAFLALGGYLLSRALQGGGPLIYFVSAVCIGMGIAAFQQARRRGSP